MHAGDPRSTAVGALASKRHWKQDASGRLGAVPALMTIAPAIPIDGLPRRFWPKRFHVLNDRAVLALTNNGSSEVISHELYAMSVDSHNILARIPYLGLRIPLKCFRGWTTYARRHKYERHQSKLERDAMCFRPRAIQLQQRVSRLLADAEAAATSGAFSLLPLLMSLDAEGKAAGRHPPTPLQYEEIHQRHCEGLRSRIEELVSAVALAVDDTWLPLNVAQEAEPQDPSSEAEGSDDDEVPAVDDEVELAARIKMAVEYEYAKAVEKAAKESSCRVGGKSPTLKESRRRAAEEVNTNAQGYHDVTPSEQLLGIYTASTMPPPPRGGYRAAMVDWRPGRLTEAKLKPEAIAFLPAHKVARLTREFRISILSPRMQLLTTAPSRPHRWPGSRASSESRYSPPGVPTRTPRKLPRVGWRRRCCASCARYAASMDSPCMQVLTTARPPPFPTGTQLP